MIQELSADNNIVNNIRNRANQHLANNPESQQAQFYTNVIKWLRDNQLRRIPDIQTYFDTLNTKNTQLQKAYIATATIDTVSLVGGSVVQILNNYLQSSNPPNPECPCLPSETTVERNRIGSGMLAGGFALGAGTNLGSFNHIANSHYAESKLVKKALVEEKAADAEPQENPLQHNQP